MGDAELAADVAGPDALVRQVYNPLPHHVRQRPPVDEDPAQLVHSAVACRNIMVGFKVI